MKAKRFIKNITLFSMSVLLALFSLSSCSNLISKDPQEPEVNIFEHKGEKLTDKVSRFKLGDKEFDLSLDREGFRAIFGDEMTEYRSEDEKYLSYNDDCYIYADVVQNGVYTGKLGFLYNENTKKYDFLSIQSIVDNVYQKNVHYTENGEVKIKDFPIKTDKFDFCLDDLKTGTANKQQINDLFGEEKINDNSSDSGDTMEAYYFDDYVMMIYYKSGIFNGIFIFKK